MNSKTLIILLALGIAGLATGWVITSHQATQQHELAVSRIGSLSNELVQTTVQLTDQKSVNARLNTDLTQRETELSTVSNKWTSVTAELLKTEAEAKAASEAAKAEIDKRNARITELEGEKDELTHKMDGLTTQITGLSGQIKETERRLAASEGDRELLKKELKRLMAEKAELEKKFSDLAALREQVKKLKEELSIRTRIDFIRRGLYGFEKKGAQLLVEGIKSPGPKTTNAAVEIKAEIGTDGSAKVSTSTNAPAAK